MIYLSGAVRTDLLRLREDLGVMLTPFHGNNPDLWGTWHAYDTGCFANPNLFNIGKYLAYLAGRRKYQQRCLFATAPDVVSDATATLERAAPVLPQIRALGYRAALVAQDGIEQSSLNWDTFDCLFIGGTTKFKLSESAYKLAAEARMRGKWVHCGRVNSLRRLRALHVSLCDSVDGTYLKFGPDENLPKLLRWLDTLKQQPTLLTL